jgi:hypothetical protein
MSQSNNKNNYYYSFKTRCRAQLRTKPGSRVRLIVDPGQRKDKNGYYHSFQTRQKGQSEISSSHESG